MKQYKVGLVGIGAVGTEMVKVLRQRKFPASEIRILATRERDEEVAGETFHVLEAKPEAFDGLDIVLFAGTEGSKGASKQFGWEAVKRGAVVIDNGDDYRMDDRVPLVIPEINPEALDRHQGFIANPNCSTIITLMGIAPLHKQVPLRHMTAVTFQSVSGTGRTAIEELEQQARAYATGDAMAVNTYPHQIAFNVLPHIDSFLDTGYTKEEMKMVNETKKIMEDDSIAVTATTVRVPVFYGHSESVNIEFEREMTPDMARKLLKKAPGIKVVDDPAKNKYPLAIDAAGKDDTYVGRIRIDDTVKYGLNMWIVADNIRKGAALNAVQIAEALIKKYL